MRIFWAGATGILLGIFFSYTFFVEHESLIAFIAPAKPVSILAFGDLMLDRTVRTIINREGYDYPFRVIEPSLKDYDIVVANAEGVFGERTSVSVADHSILRFTFDPAALPTLHELGFSVLSQANNHALNFGQSGLAQSKELMTQSGIDSFGDPENQNPGPLYKVVRGSTVAFVGYSQFSSGGADTSSTLAAIARAKSTGAFVIVYPHWGDEYNTSTTTLQTTLAHAFIDAGADAVLGSHPHVVEPVEIYQNKAIFYSLGNFIFDQSWNEAVSNGLAVGISLTSRDATYTLLPFTITKAQAAFTGEESQFVLQR